MAKKNEIDRLAQESTMAIAAGMSYGKWKALQTPTVIEKPKEKPGIRCVCEWCGKEFIQRDNRRRKYCGDTCRMSANYRRSYEREKARHGI